MGQVINELKSVIEQAILIVEKKRDLTLRRDRSEKIFIGWSSELTARHNRFDLDACSWMETTFVVAELLPGDTAASIAHFQEELEVADLREFASSDGYVFCVRTDQTGDRKVYAIDFERPFVQTKVIAKSVDDFCDWQLILLAIQTDNTFALRNAPSFREMLEKQIGIDVAYWTGTLDGCLDQY